MSEFCNMVENYIYELGYEITEKDTEESLFIIDDESKGIKNLIIDCEDSILVIEQFIFKLKDKNDPKVLLRLLQMNRDLVHGAFVIDEEGDKIIFRDTLRLESLDLNELEGSIDSLTIAMAEFSSEFLTFAK